MASRSKQAARARPKGSLRLLCAGGWGTGTGSEAEGGKVENRDGGREGGGSGTGTGGREGRAEGDERPEGTKGRRGRRRRTEGGNMKKPNREGWALYGTPEAGDDACQFWPEAGREPDRRPPGRRVRNRDRNRRLRSPKRGQRRRGWQRLTP